MQNILKNDDIQILCRHYGVSTHDMGSLLDKLNQTHETNLDKSEIEKFIRFELAQSNAAILKTPFLYTSESNLKKEQINLGTLDVPKLNIQKLRFMDIQKKLDSISSLIQLCILILLVYFGFNLRSIRDSIDFYSIESELSSLNQKNENILWLACKQSNERPAFCN